MFDPKEVYGKISLREIIGDAPVRGRLELKDWPCDELAVIELENKRGSKEYVLIAPGSDVENVTASLCTAVDRLKKEAARSGF